MVVAFQQVAGYGRETFHDLAVKKQGNAERSPSPLKLRAARKRVEFSVAQVPPPMVGSFHSAGRNFAIADYIRHINALPAVIPHLEFPVVIFCGAHTIFDTLGGGIEEPSPVEGSTARTQACRNQTNLVLETNHHGFFTAIL